MKRKHGGIIALCSCVFVALTILYYRSFSLTSDGTVLIDDGIAYAQEAESGEGKRGPSCIF